VYEDEPMRTLVGLASLAILVGTATPAYADPAGGESASDGSFIASLNQGGVPFKDANTAISIGHKACQLMDQGHPKSEIITSLSSDNPGFPADAATKFADSAATAFCPQHAGEPDVAPPTPLPVSQWPIIDFPIITPPA
jgi:hypothetical protein